MFHTKNHENYYLTPPRHHAPPLRLRLNLEEDRQRRRLCRHAHLFLEDPGLRRARVGRRADAQNRRRNDALDGPSDGKDRPLLPDPPHPRTQPLIPKRARDRCIALSAPLRAA